MVSDEVMKRAIAKIMRLVEKYRASGTGTTKLTKAGVAYFGCIPVESADFVADTLVKAGALQESRYGWFYLAGVDAKAEDRKEELIRLSNVWRGDELTGANPEYIVAPGVIEARQSLGLKVVSKIDEANIPDKKGRIGMSEKKLFRAKSVEDIGRRGELRVYLNDNIGVLSKQELIIYRNELALIQERNPSKRGKKFIKMLDGVISRKK